MRKVRRGLLPVAGAAHCLATSCPEGVALARYLAVTGRALRADELFRCGAHRPRAPAYLIVVAASHRVFLVACVSPAWGS
jgi:enoyl-CoA hydratase/carnithine racemase